MATTLSRRSVLAGASLTALIATLAACGSQDGAATTADQGEADSSVPSAMSKDNIVIGYDNTFVPMGFDENGETKGFDKDLSDYVAQKIGKTFVFQNIDWEMKEAELNSGKIDAIWNGYSISEERRKKVDATEPYLDNTQIFMVPADSQIMTKADLAGRKLATQTGSTAADLIKEDKDLVDSLDGAQALEYSTYDLALRDLEVGRADAVAGDSVLLEYYAKQKGSEKFRVLDDNLGSEQFVVAVRKGDDEFRDALNKAIDEARADGTLEQITTTWFN